MFFYNMQRQNREAARRYLPGDMPVPMFMKRWYARNYGWTPRQVETLTLGEAEMFPLIESAAQDALDMLREQEHHT